jgi:hypothetical protein
LRKKDFNIVASHGKDFKDLEEAGWELKRKILEFDAAEISLQRDSDYSDFFSKEKKGRASNLNFMDSPED